MKFDGEYITSEKKRIHEGRLRARAHDLYEALLFIANDDQRIEHSKNKRAQFIAKYAREELDKLEDL